MGIFRSRKMVLCQILLHKESAFDCMMELGYSGTVQFRETGALININSVFTRDVQRCSDMKRTLDYFQKEMELCDIEFVYYPNVDRDEVPRTSDVNYIEEQLNRYEEELLEVERRREEYERKRLHLQEKLFVLNRAEEFFSGKTNVETVMAWSESVVIELLRDEAREMDLETGTFKSDKDRRGQQYPQYSQRLNYFTGAIPVERFKAFHQMLCRVCSRNFFIRWDEIPMPMPDPRQPSVKVRKYAFAIAFHGLRMGQKISRICQAFSVVLFEYEEGYYQRKALRNRINTEIKDLEAVERAAERHRRYILNEVRKDYYIWRSKVKKMLQAYTMLNKMETIPSLSSSKYLQAQCWVPKKYLNKTRYALMRGARRASRGGMVFPPSLIEMKYRSVPNCTPPTSYRLNKFTVGFQRLINSYGVAVYKELNPTPFTIVTFPFLFAVMFGDVGHGIIMTIFAAWMCYTEKAVHKKMKMQRKPSEIFSILFKGRYVILLMGIFSIYTGLIYNDVFSKSFNFFGSHWRCSYTWDEIKGHKTIQLDPANPDYYLGVPYMFGIDPVWGAAGENAITTMNSYKMKLAVILGVIHMFFGMCLSAWNHVYFNAQVELGFMFVPQIVFLSCIFVYLIVLIFYKWFMYGGYHPSPYNSACAPSILITFIDMLLMKSSQKPPEGCDEQMYPLQKIIQYALVAMAILSIPVLLIGKPIYIMRNGRRIRSMQDGRRRNKMKRKTVDTMRRTLSSYTMESTNRAKSALSLSSHSSLDAERIDLAELWIHQAIHCIESVLGAVSHTASYLRLWALSLAHDQLATVLWNMVLAVGLKGQRGFLNSVTIYLVFWIWAILTVAILVVMEGLSAFLHTLRLHWVEFQSKFYTGAGESFQPFRFESSRID